jgi:hypothetical protein
MRITLDISDELAGRIQAHGLDPQSFAQNLIDDAARNAPLPLPPAKPKVDMKTLLQEMAADSEKIPQLPDEAFTRESFYRDHD